MVSSSSDCKSSSSTASHFSLSNSPVLSPVSQHQSVVLLRSVSGNIGALPKLEECVRPISGKSIENSFGSLSRINVLPNGPESNGDRFCLSPKLAQSPTVKAQQTQSRCLFAVQSIPQLDDKNFKTLQCSEARSTPKKEDETKLVLTNLYAIAMYSKYKVFGMFDFYENILKWNADHPRESLPHWLYYHDFAKATSTNGWLTQWTLSTKSPFHVASVTIPSCASKAATAMVTMRGVADFLQNVILTTSTQLWRAVSMLGPRGFWLTVSSRAVALSWRVAVADPCHVIDCHAYVSSQYSPQLPSTDASAAAAAKALARAPLRRRTSIAPPPSLAQTMAVSATTALPLSPLLPPKENPLAVTTPASPLFASRNLSRAASAPDSPTTGIGSCAVHQPPPPPSPMLLSRSQSWSAAPPAELTRTASAASCAGAGSGAMPGGAYILVNSPVL